MDPRFFGQSESGDWMLGVPRDICFDFATSTTDNNSAPEMEPEIALFCNPEDDCIVPPPGTHENPMEFASFDEHVNSYTTDLEPVLSPDLLDQTQSL
ncbi:Zinc finger C2H2 [Penicillium robsamsonii]|uniref:Zinc finger C2H2 n=1 Tax=Penicillium robsamsonii TaxID=1792511 RepID=UPI002547BE7A|nr:Zinc finger C2H2 [Penicillium robsamsonii]KAJ5817147.1 Zinc finger C2H2 [Penicillium robsamsonii]